MHSADNPQKALNRPLVPSKTVCLRFGIVDRTLDRWIASKSLAFPRPIVINRRRYFEIDEVTAWENTRKQAAPSDEASKEAA